MAQLHEASRQLWHNGRTPELLTWELPAMTSQKFRRLAATGAQSCPSHPFSLSRRNRRTHPVAVLPSRCLLTFEAVIGYRKAFLLTPAAAIGGEMSRGRQHLTVNLN